MIIKITNYQKLKNKKPYKIILIDPGVYDLGNSDFYPWENKIDIDAFLDSLPKNHYFTWDYPGDMNPNYAEDFLRKSWQHAVQYCQHSNYIVTVQFRYNNYMSFVEWFDKYNSLENASGILGIGNICK